ncbi:alpha/beta hydrolase [soil metagenome]
MADSRQASGTLPSGSTYRLAVPAAWNDMLLLLARPIPQDPAEEGWGPDASMVSAMLAEGYAVTGSVNTMFWPLERAFADHDPLLEAFTRQVAHPGRVIAVGTSIGGIMTAGLVQVAPERFAGALPLCGNLSGAVATHNREFDIAFTIKTLLAADTPLEVARISDPAANLRLARTVLEQAQVQPSGRARLALAAAMGNMPGWHDPAAPEPAVDDVVARQRAQYEWYDEVCFLVFFWARQQVEQQAGGNPSWNDGVDYRALLATSINRDVVDVLYREAGLDLEADLDALAAAPRTTADPDAVAYLERHIVFDGQLGGVPVLTVHSDGDGLVTPDNERAYRDVVAWAGQSDLLRQLHVHRGGHCTFTAAETVVALDALVARIDGGRWPELDPDGLNAAVAAKPPAMQMIRTGQQAAPAFIDYQPWQTARPYDARHQEERRRATAG